MISLNPQDAQPLYEQVVDQFRGLIVAGIMAPGDRLPSVRALATKLAINPNTIQRAYRELEAAGYICSTPGRGSFVADAANIHTARRHELLRSFDDIVGQLKKAGFTVEELTTRIKEDYHD